MVSGCSSSSGVPSQPPELNAPALTALDAQHATTTLAATPLAQLASSGRRVLTSTVGLDRTGRLTQATASAEQVLFGKRVLHVIVQSWFPKPTGVAPAAPQIPAAADTAEADDFY